MVSHQGALQLRRHSPAYTDGIWEFLGRQWKWFGQLILVLTAFRAGSLLLSWHVSGKGHVQLSGWLHHLKFGEKLAFSSCPVSARDLGRIQSGTLVWKKNLRLGISYEAMVCAA